MTHARAILTKEPGSDEDMTRCISRRVTGAQIKQQIQRTVCIRIDKSVYSSAIHPNTDLRAVKGGGGGEGGLDHVSRKIKLFFHNSGKKRHNEKPGSRRIKHLFLVSRKIILENHASRLVWTSRFTRKKLTISHFTGKKKGPITIHENSLYQPLT